MFNSCLKPTVPPVVTVRACDSSPCQNGGTCVELSGENSYHCNCSESFTGARCEVEQPIREYHSSRFCLFRADYSCPHYKSIRKTGRGMDRTRIRLQSRRIFANKSGLRAKALGQVKLGRTNRTETTLQSEKKVQLNPAISNSQWKRKKLFEIADSK